MGKINFVNFAHKVNIPSVLILSNVLAAYRIQGKALTLDVDKFGKFPALKLSRLD